jgi:hypothetical protein
MTGNNPTLTAALAHEHTRTLLLAAERSRRLAGVPGRRRTPRRRPLWWIGVTARSGSAVAA